MGYTVRINNSVEAFYLIQPHLGRPLPPSLQPATTKAPVFISIDAEYNNKCITQLGISTFDSQVISSSPLERPISNEYPISSALYSTKTRPYRERRRKPSHFGEKHILVPGELRALLTELLTPKDAEGYPRDAILVGHMIVSDLTAIEKFCGLKICRDIPSVKAILDTQRISRPVLDPLRRLSLKRLLNILELDYIGLHNAAHDSRYTLRALLLMFCRAVVQRSSTMLAGSDDMMQRIALVKEIAIFHRPRVPIFWCNNSPRNKFDGNPDMLDQEHDASDLNGGGLLTGIFEVELG